MDMQIKYVMAPAMVIAALFSGGCASDGSLIGPNMATSSTTPAKPVAKAPKIDPACIQLTARIDAIRKDGIVDRVEKVSTGKSKTVSVYRSSLAKMAELDRANAEFQAKCSSWPNRMAAVAPAKANAAAPNTQSAAAPAAAPGAAKTAAPPTAAPKKP